VSRIRTITALGAAAVSLAAAGPALASSSHVGNAGGTPNMNICLLDFQCTYINTHHGARSDVIRHSGTLTRWTVNAASSGSPVRLRILRPVGHGRLKFVRSSAMQTTQDTGPNTFTAHIPVKRGDVLGLTNTTSALVMENSDDPSRAVKYFDYTAPQSRGSVGKPDQTYPQPLRLLLSARVRH
jgi:hypothetical protein